MTEQVDLDALEALAKAATPGPWTAGVDGGEPEVRAGEILRHEIDFLLREGGHAQGVADAEFIAAADPSTVLALIAELRQKRERADEAADAAQGQNDLNRELGAALSRAEETIEKIARFVGSPGGKGAWLSGHFPDGIRAILTEYDKQKGTLAEGTGQPTNHEKRRQP